MTDPRLPLGTWPTPVEPAPRLARALGLGADDLLTGALPGLFGHPEALARAAVAPPGDATAVVRTSPSSSAGRGR